MNLKTFQSDTGEELLYTGRPDMKIVEQLVHGPGDVWHSSANQGFQNCFPELVYPSPQCLCGR